MDLEKTAWLVILVLNLAGILFMVAMAVGRLMKDHLRRFNVAEEEALFDLEAEEAPPDVAEITETTPKPPVSGEKPPAPKPKFDIDDFDFDL